MTPLDVTVVSTVQDSCFFVHVLPADVAASRTYLRSLLPT